VDDRILNDRYRIESRLGDGGMAIVYCGTDVVLRRRVAIKVLRDQFASDEDFVKRFYYEAEAAAKLSHPNIVTTFDMGRDGESYFIVMELVDGSTLAEMIRSDGKLPEPVAIDYGIQIASGLAYAHRQGLLHRDVKPANILVASDDVLKLSDFGIARAVSSQALSVTQPGMVMGSVSYISPEQAQGLDLAETSDLYSLGAVLYQMVTGELPFSGESPVTVALKHVSAPIPQIDLKGKNVSPALAAIITRLLQKSPSDRYASANDVAVALREAREKPTLVGARTGNGSADAPTMRFEAVRPPQPPPRRSASPDRPAFDEVAVPHEEIVAVAPSPLRWIVLAALLVVAAVGGYLLFQGKVFPLTPAGAAIPDVAGRSFAQAQQTLVQSGFRVVESEEFNDGVPPDRVIRQDPAAGAVAQKDALVTLVVSKGRTQVDVPDIVGFTTQDAQKALKNAGFDSRVTSSRYGPEARGQVVAENPPGGKPASKGGSVALTVSKGPQPVTVPSLVALSVDDATAALAKLSLKANVSREPSDNIAENNVMSQDPRPGEQLDPQATVQLVVSSGPTTQSVPDVSGKTIGDATAALQAAGFGTQLAFSVEPSNASGNVIAQDPASGAAAKKHANVTITVAVAGTVPDVSGMGLAQAQAVLRDNGYKPGNVADSPDGAVGKVVRTEPEANNALRPGESVTIYVGTGASPTPVVPPTSGR
jgi:serine/threonine-protein kinase